jgi:hypothetical protein
MGVATSTAILGAAAIGAVGAGMQSDAAKDAAAMQVAGGDRAISSRTARCMTWAVKTWPHTERQGTRLSKTSRKRMPLFTSQFGEEQMAQYLDPSMEFRRRLGEQTTARMLNVGGGAISGNTLRGLEDYGQNLASTEYGNAFNRFQNERTNIYNTLANIAGMGKEAVNTGVTGRPELCREVRLGLLLAKRLRKLRVRVGAANAYSGALGNRRKHDVS